MGEKREAKWEKEGKRLKAARLTSGLSQYAVAERLGVNRHVVWYWETGRSFPTPEHLRQLADLYGISVDWLHRVVDAGPKELRETPASYEVDREVIQELYLFLRAPGITPEAIKEIAEYLRFRRLRTRQ